MRREPNLRSPRLSSSCRFHCLGRLDDLPVTFLYPQVWTTVAHRRVKGLSEPYRTDPLWHLDEVWIEE